ncbi:PREDICTED: uncharacterized protein LOC106899072 [Calidris pugnax]|uniref:uncharacterized protein LOC106899072 n=1 Tax=Calidris pugnax TaxID=198806 RepID=UPI00071CEC59|nr:PREDICTED: uncharacterized protein LOC106899072 [Calidris pugnax]
MMLVPVVVLWALAPFLIQAATDQPPVTLTASPGEDACLPCGTQPWGHLRGVTLTCTHQAGDHHPVLILSHLLGWQPPQEPGWHPTQEPESRFRGRVAFCTAGPGDTGVSLLLRNLSHPDFGNYSCYVATNASDVPQLLCSLVLQPDGAGPGDTGVSLLLRNLSHPDFGNYSCYVATNASDVPQLLCSLVLQPDGAEVLKDAEPDMIMVVCVLTAAFTTVAIGVVICCRCGRRCCGHREPLSAIVMGSGDDGAGGKETNVTVTRESK